MRKLLALVNAATNAVVNTAEYNPFEDKSQEKATRELDKYRNNWYQNTNLFNDVSLVIKEISR